LLVADARAAPAAPLRPPRLGPRGLVHGGDRGPVRGALLPDRHGRRGAPLRRAHASAPAARRYRPDPPAARADPRLHAPGGPEAATRGGGTRAARAPARRARRAGRDDVGLAPPGAVRAGARPPVGPCPRARYVLHHRRRLLVVPD